MRYLFSTLLATTFSLVTYAQTTGGCGTIHPSDYEHTLSAEERSVVNSLPNSQRAGIRWVGVVYHIITKNDGTGGASLKDVFISHCELNEYYYVFDIGFFVYEIDTIKNTTLWNYQTSQGNTTFNQHNVANYINVYVNGNLPGLCGFATYPWGTSNRQGGIFLNKSCIGAGTQTYAHEMGHYLNLPHTFETSDGIELVNGSNCATAGDGFCDTPADFIDYRVACPYSGDSTDPNGDLYRTVIDETLFMSYFSDNCVYRFSPEEQDEMNATLTNRRSYLLNRPLPDFAALDSVQFVTPLDGDTAVNSTNILFKWHSIPGAVYYNLRVQSSTSTIVSVDTMLTDTSYTLSTLTSNKSYKFRVIPYSFGNTCGENAAYRFLKTSTIKTVATVTPATCAGSNDATISINATNGTNPYTYDWNNGSTGPSLNNLGPGTYTITVVDNQGEVVVTNVVIPEPQSLIVTVNAVGSNLNAYGSGGTAPYTYTWSNGVNGQYNNNVAYGSYEVTVTDARGCSTVHSFIFSSVEENTQEVNDVTIFPNPVNGVAMLRVQVDFKAPGNAEVALVNVSGQTIEQIRQDFSSGIHLVSFHTAHLPAGVYLVKVKSNSSLWVNRFTIVK